MLTDGKLIFFYFAHNKTLGVLKLISHFVRNESDSENVSSQSYKTPLKVL